MKQLFKNIAFTYLAIIVLLAAYLFCVKIKISSNYEAIINGITTGDKITVYNKLRSTYQNKVFLNIQLKRPLKAIKANDEFRLRYDILIDKKREEHISEPVKEVFPSTKKNEFRFEADTALMTLATGNSKMINTYLIVRTQKTVFNILFEKIINPFIH
jgi:hypothetical protein